MKVGVASRTFQKCFLLFALLFVELIVLTKHANGAGFIRLKGDGGKLLGDGKVNALHHQKLVADHDSDAKIREKKEFDSYKNSTRNGRIFNPLNPFDLFGNPLCQHERLDGKCYEFVRCLALAGKIGPLCRGFRGICCRFLRECGQRSSQEVVYWSNYIREDKKKKKKKKHKRKPKRNWADPASTCEFNIIRRTKNHCGLKVMPFIHPKTQTNTSSESSPDKTKVSSDETCLDTKLAIVGLGDRLELNLCSARDSVDIKEYTIGMEEVNELKITLENRGRSTNRIDVKVIQLKCTEYNGEDLSGTSTGSVGFGETTVPEETTEEEGFAETIVPAETTEEETGETTTGEGTTTEQGGDNKKPETKPPSPPSSTTKPTSTTTSTKRPTTNPLPDYSKCGIKGPERIGKDRILDIYEDLKEIVDDSGGESRDDAIEEQPQGPPIANKNSSSEGRQDESASAEWAVPTLDDTVFHHFMGDTPTISITRITGGKVAKPLEYPWQCALFVGSGKFSCGCSVIGNRFILTAAHCVNSQRTNPGAVTFHVGDWDLYDKRETRHQLLHARSIRVHPDYSSRNLQNDIAIVKVHEFIQYNRGVRPICLPRRGLNVEGKLATVTGWGRDRNKKLQGKLKELTAAVISNRLCGQRWNAHPFIVDTMLCMDTHIGDSCNGDSGGPTVVEDGNVYVQVGIVSFGSGSCTDSQLPGVYTRVSKYVDWIYQNLH